jgi:hypothetical protein
MREASSPQTPQNTSAPTGERRREERVIPGERVLKSAQIIYSAGLTLETSDCIVHNISAGGACVELGQNLAPEFGFLHMHGDIIRAFRRCWVEDGRMGLEFCSTTDLPPLPGL